MKPLIFFDFEQTDDGKVIIEKEKLIEIFDKIYTSGFDDGSKSKPIPLNDQITWTGTPKVTTTPNITDNKIPFMYTLDAKTNDTDGLSTVSNIKTISHTDDKLDSNRYLAKSFSIPYWKIRNKAIIIAGYPGIGKSTIFEYHSIYSEKRTGTLKHHGHYLRILDSDSSLFRWKYDINGVKLDEKNLEFPNNYINHIKENLYSQDIIFVSTHKVVRDALKDAGLEYIVAYPDKSLKKEYMNCYKFRGNDDAFINFQDKMWDSFIDDIEHDEYPSKICVGKDTAAHHLRMKDICDILKLE